MNRSIDTTRLTLLLNELRLPATKHLWESFTERSDKEGWPGARLLMALAEHEIAERDRRRIERHLGEAKLLPDKTLQNYDFEAVPMISKAQVSALCAGDGWLDKGANLLLFGPPGGGKSHLASAIGLALLEKGWRVFFTRTSDLVQKLQVARREFALEAAIQRLDRYHLLILDDLVYVTWGASGKSVHLYSFRVAHAGCRIPRRIADLSDRVAPRLNMRRVACGESGYASPRSVRLQQVVLATHLNRADCCARRAA
jgi:DNA replication protein DnaC